ncbi:MAG: C4-dicarboxylate transporter DcuC [Planctomycetes bacterium]|nr:C4-dicarboxylate transporter DcuC [Planctomycetota bacterium]
MEWFLAVVAGGAIVMVVRGWDVRLVLLTASLLIAGAAGNVPAVVREFLATFSNEKFVVPICSAMGFAYVLRHTGCERHLVLLLVQPLRYVRALLVPGVVAIGFLVNIPLVSQTSTAVCLGAVVVPLMRAAGYSMATIGACLLLGASVGGELLNPGAPELQTVASANPGHPRAAPQVQATNSLPPLVFTQLAVATVVIWVMSVWWERAAKVEGGPPAPSPFTVWEREIGSPAETERINLVKALVPLVPLVLLFAAAPPFKFVDIPDEWVIPRKADGKRDPAYDGRLVGLAMLVGVLVAAAVTPNKSGDCVKEFFTGAGYGFTNVVSLIVTATCFGKAIETAGVAQKLGALIEQAPELMQPLAAFVPLAFAAVSGSGMASTQSLYGFFHAPALALGLDPVAVGAMVSVGSAAGRTMSPVAAVVLMCGTLTGTNPFTLAKRVAVPLFAGIGAVVLLRLAGAF